MIGYFINEIASLHKKFNEALYILSEGIGNNDKLIYMKLNNIEREINDEKENRN